MKNTLNSFFTGNKAILIVFVLGTILSFATPVFLTPTNLMNVLRQVCTSTIIACGFAVVLGSGQIDLSVGSILGVVNMAIALLMSASVPIPIAIVLVLLLGYLLGIGNAFLIRTFKLPSFVVTLGTGQILRGICYLITSMVPVRVPESFSVVGQGSVGIIPVPLFIMLGIVLITWVMVFRTKFGRHVIATGGNEDASRVSGINTNKVFYGVFGYMGLCGAIAGIVTAARAASGQPTAGLNMEMDAIAAVVIGGTPLIGGSANVIGAVFGCLIINIVSNGLNLLNINSHWQVIAKGILIIFAIVLDSTTTSFLRNLAVRRAREKDEAEHSALPPDV